MLKITNKVLNQVLEARAKEVVINVMKYIDDIDNIKKAAVKDFIYSGFRSVNQDIKTFNEGLFIQFTPQD